MQRQSAFLFIAVLIAATFLNACAGSSSGGTSPSGTIIPQSAAKAVLTALGQSSILTGVDKPPVSKSFSSGETENSRQVSDAKQIRDALSGLKNMLGQKHFQKMTEEALPCDSGTALRTRDDNDTPLDVTDDRILTQYNDCLELRDRTTLLTQGTISLSASRSDLALEINRVFTDLSYEKQIQ